MRDRRRKGKRSVGVIDGRSVGGFAVGGGNALWIQPTVRLITPRGDRESSRRGQKLWDREVRFRFRVEKDPKDHFAPWLGFAYCCTWFKY